MALSGSFGTDVNSHWRLQIDWSATQNVSENKSTITVKLFWMATDGYGAVNSSSSKTAGIKINGGAWNNVSKSGLASLSGNQKKLIHSESWTVGHNSDGTKSIDLDGYFDAEITLNGTYYGTINLPEKTYALNTIPRESVLNDTAPSWKAGSDTTFSIKRYANFKHELEIYLEDSGGTTAPDGRKYTHLKQLVYTTSQTSKSSSFTTAEKYETFVRLDGASSKRTWVRLQTFSGDNMIGSTNEYYGTVTAPNASKPTASAFNLGESVNIAISRSDGEFQHEVKVSVGSWSKVLTSTAETSYTWNTSTDSASILGQIGSATSKDITITLTTYYYNGSSKKIVRSPVSINVKCNVPNSQAPTFTGAVTWTDSNATLNTLKGTGNNAIMIQGKSTLVVTLPSSALATAKTGTTMKNYTVTINGKTRSVNHPSTATNLTFTFTPAELNVGKNQTMKVTAFDNRGLSTSVNKTVTFVAYSTPTASMIGKRNDGFGNISTIGVGGSIAPLNVAGANKNSITNVKYRVKKKGYSDTTYTALVTMTLATATFPKFQTANISDLDLDSKSAWTIQFQVTDKLGTYSYTKDIASGVPIIAWDKNGSVGIGKYPEGTSPLEMGANKYRAPSTNSAKTSVGGAIDLNNSDITNPNGIWFADRSDNDGEGLFFPRSNFPTDGTDTVSNNFDQFYIRDKVVYLNGVPMYQQESRILYTNAGIVMDAGDTITPSKGIEACPNGWVLVFGRAEGRKENWYYYHVPKEHVSYHNGGGNKIPFAGGGQESNTTSYKYLYINKTTIVGNDTNKLTSAIQDIVLKYVLSY